MARSKKNRPAPRTAPDLSDWRGHRAQRRAPRFGLLGFLAILAVLSTAAVAYLDGPAGLHFFDLWLLSLVAVQLLVVAESRHWFRGAMRWVLPVVTAVAVPLLLVYAFGARDESGVVLALLNLLLALAPERWLDNLVAGPRG